MEKPQENAYYVVREGFVFPYSTDGRKSRDYEPGDSVELPVTVGDADHRLERAQPAAA